jgi:hypothetical protein
MDHPKLRKTAQIFAEKYGEFSLNSAFTLDDSNLCGVAKVFRSTVHRR